LTHRHTLYHIHDIASHWISIYLLLTLLTYSYILKSLMNIDRLISWTFTIIMTQCIVIIDIDNNNTQYAFNRIISFEVSLASPLISLLYYWLNIHNISHFIEYWEYNINSWILLHWFIRDNNCFDNSCFWLSQ